VQAHEAKAGAALLGLQAHGMQGAGAWGHANYDFCRHMRVEGERVGGKVDGLGRGEKEGDDGGSLKTVRILT